FAGTTDGTLNIQPANGLIPNQAGLNALDGWSTTAPIRIRFGGALDAASFSAANIRVYQVTVSNTTKAVSGFTRPLTFGTEFSAGLASDTGVGPTILEIRPLVPLQPSAGPATPTSPLPDGTGYLVLLTDGLKMASGAAATADTDYATIKTTLGAGIDPSRCATLPNTPMQGACGFTASHLLVAANPALGALALDPADVVVSFHFSTVATRDTLRVLGLTIFNPQAPAPAIAVAPTAIPLNMINDALPAAASARAGTVTVPYYSYIPTPQAPGGISTDSNVLRTAWRAAAAPPAPLTDPGDERNLTRFNPIPEKRADKAIPLLVIMPNDDAGPAGVKPAAGWPVLIFEHGITRNRTDAFAVAQAFALNGWVIASIDLPLHGITDTASPLYQASNEQTFNLDLVVNASGASGPDGVIDPTGTHFINLPFPLASRDAVRQGAVNLLALTRALPDLDLDGDGEGDVDPARIAFLGHSLGAIVGIDFAAALPLPTDFPAPADFTVNPMRVPTVVLNAPGGGLAELLRDSVTFGPRINAGLQAQGLLPGTSLYAQYFRDVQNIVDAGDPLNYVTQAAARRSIYIQQVVGGGDANSLPDQVIPNSATQRLITAITNNGLAGGLPFPRATPGNNVAGDGYVNFIFGDHGSILNPGTSATTAATTGEMQAEAFLYTAGNPGVPLPPGVIVPGALTTVPVEP
ncbi:MAG TPA: hypothetical protein VFP37_17290, partial [Steroidobacteraceae bacterium]|nr:hypothetical protein [Steroidobacteraceae bacterium]